jgi:lipopolysaccharide export system permease protein
MRLMNDLHRSIVLDTLKVFAATTLVAMLLMTLGGGAKEGISRGLPPTLVLRIMPYLLPEVLRFVIPGCLLFAVCSVYGQMSAANEVTALKSLGINPLRIVWPALVLAYALSMFTYWLYDLCAVWARPSLQRQVAQSVDEIVYGYLKSNRSFRSQGVSIVVRDIVADRLISPMVRIEAGKDSKAVVLMAEQARLRAEPTRGVLHIECDRGHLEVPGKGSLSFPDGFVQDVALRDFNAMDDDQLSPAALGLARIPSQVKKEREEIAKLLRAKQERPAQENAAKAQEAEMLRFRRERLNRLLAEPSRRLSNGLGCLCFSIVGVPVALLRRSADVMSIFFLCFVPILLLYYPLLMLGESLARQGTYPQYSVWLADLALLSAGILLLFRSTRR